MSEQTKIQWADSTINFWIGCTKVSAGCANCYAEKNIGVKMRGQKWGDSQPRVKSVSAVKQALAMNRRPWICDNCGHATAVSEWHGSKGDECPKCMSRRGHRRRIFSLSLGDWLDDKVPIEWLAEMLDTIRQCDQVTWILCSKRWENFNNRIEAVKKCAVNSPAFWKTGGHLAGWLDGWSHGLNVHTPKNIIGLCSVENQEMADQRIPQFLTVPLASRGLSMEPLLGKIDISTGTYSSNGRGLVWDAFGKPAHIPRCDYPNGDAPNGQGVSWLIVGGESGSNARPCDVKWIRSIVQQGEAAGVATFVKQLGSFHCDVDSSYEPEDWAKQLKHPKGGDPSEWPADLRMQQWPKGF